MIKVMKVTGDSLSPFYMDGDFVVLITSPLFLKHVKPGDKIVFQQPDYGVLVKQVVQVDEKALFVSGTHRNSVDSRRFGPIRHEDIIGRVIWHIPASRK